MIRELQVVANKPITLITTSEAMKRGAVIVEDYKTETVKNATSGATDIYFVDVEPTYEGINAVVEPTDGSWENIKAKAEELYRYAIEKSTPVVEKAADEVRKQSLKVVKEIEKKLEDENKSKK